MPRLAIALTTALVLHIMLLMTTFPVHQVIKQEFHGSGHVTVSIVRHQTPVPDIVDEPLAETDQVEKPEETVQQVQEIEEAQLPDKVSRNRKSEPVKDMAIHEKPLTENPKKEIVARNIKPSKPVPAKVSPPVKDIPSSDQEASISAVESLRYPEPLEVINPLPIYPPLARKRGWQGTVLLEVDVLRDGMVKSVQVKESSSFALLDKEALKAVRKWRFSPGLKAGEPVPMKVLVPVHFLLEDN